MLALSMWQPWATLHVASCALLNGAADRRAKTIESRSWPLATSGFITLPAVVAIHATKGIKRDERAAIIQDGRFVEPFGSLLVACGYSRSDPWASGYDENFVLHDPPAPAIPFSRRESGYLRPLPRGAIVGVLTYHRQCRGTEIIARRGDLALGPRRFEVDLGYYDESKGPRYGWVSTNAVALAEPLPCVGHQKLWQMPNEIQNHPLVINALQVMERRARDG